MDIAESNKRIAKNTLFLYLRMIITMGVTLYTSRVVLNVLGIEDFGIYSIIFGFVVLLGFLQSAMTNSSQRFISFELGRGENSQVKKIFSMNMTVHISISLFVLLLSETVGLWFVNTQLNIPPDRMLAANWVYQFSILIFITNILRTPYNASIIAYENMSFYAYISIIESLLKLLIVFLLPIIAQDKLIFYGILLFLVSLICSIIYKIYCFHKIPTCKYVFYWNKELYWEIMSFSGWSMFSGIANVGAQQGSNLLLNIYNGVIVNAAFGIANQVSQAVYAFSSSFQKAFYPQITKLYAVADTANLKTLVFRTSLYSYYLILIMAVPFLINSELVLQLWLKNIPDYSVIFCQLMVVYQLIDAFQAPLNVLILSTGKIRTYNIWLSSLIILNIPISWYLLSNGASPYYVLLIRVSINFITGIIRIIYIRYFINFPSYEYLIKVVLKVIPITVLSFGLSYFIKEVFKNDLAGFFYTTISAIILTCTTIYFIGTSNNERKFFMSLLLKFIPKSINQFRS